MEQALKAEENHSNSFFGGKIKNFKEGKTAKAIENRTAKLPSDIFLWSAFAGIAGALALKVAGRDKDAQFVGQWAPTLLTIGVYNKMVKLFGND